MTSKRTGFDVLAQFQAALQAALSNPALLERAAMSMTPEELRKAHEGLLVLTNCMAAVAPAITVAPAAQPAALPPVSLPIALTAEWPAALTRTVAARRAQPATESA